MLSEEKVLELLKRKLSFFIITNNDVYLESVFTLRDVLELSDKDIEKMYREIMHEKMEEYGLTSEQ